jgi:GAF domain-containing protein
MDGAYAEEFARLAIDLHEQPGVPETVDVVLQYALGAVGADTGSVMLLRNGGRAVEIAGTTDPSATRADHLQLDTGEGPCLDAARDETDSTVISDTRTDERWPVWCKRVAGEVGIGSVLSVQLGTPKDRAGALNLYAGQPGRFDADDQAVAHVLARHAAVALARSDRVAHLWQAIDARKLIGQAQGILMERFDLDADQAFAALRQYSQDNNLKLRDVAQRLVDTRRLPDTAGPGDH